MNNILIGVLAALALAACSTTPKQEGGAPVDERTPGATTDSSTRGAVSWLDADELRAVSGTTLRSGWPVLKAPHQRPHRVSRLREPRVPITGHGPAGGRRAHPPGPGGRP